MHIRESIERFSEQLAYEPVIENRDRYVRRDRFLILAMGGSQWPANLLNAWDESLFLWQHRDYGLPALSDAILRDFLVIVVSYSGNTEEAISGLESALDRGYPVIAIGIGGKLIDIAKERAVPYIQLPDWKMQPRASTGLLLRALTVAIGSDRGSKELAALASSLIPKDFEAAGKQLATQCEGSVPIVYASRRNGALAMTWKIKLNETGKIPAFFNVFPEHNHNEHNGFDISPKTENLARVFRWVFLTDDQDHPRIQRRFDVIEELYQRRGHSVFRSPLKGETRFERILGSALTADWFSLFTAEQYGLEATEVPMVEEMKKLINT